MFFMIILTIHSLISLGTLLAHENIEVIGWFFYIIIIIVINYYY